MSDLIKFEDLEIPALTEAAKESFEEALWATEKALAKQLEFGRVMLIVKSKLPYGEWGNWVRETFQDQMSLRNIQFHMKAHQEVAKNPSLLECANSLDEILTLTEKPRKASVEVIASKPSPEKAPETVGSGKPAKPQENPVIPAKDTPVAGEKPLRMPAVLEFIKQLASDKKQQPKLKEIAGLSIAEMPDDQARELMVCRLESFDAWEISLLDESVQEIRVRLGQ